MNMPTTTGVAPETPVRKPDGGSPGRLSDRARRPGSRPQPRSVNCSIAPPPRPGRSSARSSSLPAGCAPDDLPALLQRYYWSEPAAEVLGHDPDELAGLALGHLKLAEVRPPGSATVDVQRLPDGRSVDPPGHRRHAVPGRLGHRRGRPAGRRRWRTSCTRSSSSAATCAGTDQGLLRQLADAVGCGPDALTESWMAVVVDGPLDDEAAADLVTGLRTVLDDVRAVDEDADRLRARVLELADAARGAAPRSAGGRAPTPPTTRPRPPRCCAGWPTATSSSSAPATSTSSSSRGKPAARAVARHRPGRAAQRHRHERRRSPACPRPPAPPRQHLLDRHQGRRPLPRAPPRLAGPGRGHPAARPTAADPAATASSGCSRRRRTPPASLDVPLVRRRVAEVIARSGVPADSHTGKELLDVLETYPRDELLQVGADELLPVALAVLHLQERRQTRLFLRQDPTGRFWSALVYLPRDRYTTEVRLAMQQILLERLGGTEHRVHGAVHRVGAGAAALRRPRAGGPRAARRSRWPSTSRRCRPSWPPPPAAGPTTSPTRCTPGTAADAERMLARVADAFPAAYQEDFPAEQAVDDLERLDGLQPPASSSLRLLDAERRGARRAAADRSTGSGSGCCCPTCCPCCRTWASTSSTSGPTRSTASALRRPGSTTSALAVAAVAELPLLRSLPERFTEALAAVWRGEAEDDGLGALVLLAGLQLAAGHRRPGLRAVAAPGRAALRPGLRRADAGRAPRRRRPAGGAVRDALLPRARPAGASARQDDLVESLRTVDRRGRVASTPTGCSSRCSPPSPPPSARRTTPAARWRSSSTRPRCPTCPSRGRPARSGSARRG